jgi:DNA-binding beta-propeller fold protein YncE
MAASRRLTLVVGGFCGVCMCIALSALVLISCYALQPLPDVLPGGLLPLFEVATGFAWAENLVCVLRRNESFGPSRAASLFVTDNQRGDLVRIDWISHERSGRYARPVLHPASPDFSLMAGVATNRRTGQMWVLANPRPLAREREHCVLIEVDPFAQAAERPSDAYAVVASLDRKCLGDGLAVHEASGLLYAANQGAFVPGHGAVYEIDPTTGRVSTVISGAFGPDGVFIDQPRQLLYVTESLSPTHSVLVYDLAARNLVGRIHPRGVSALDDFTLSADGTAIIAADFLGNSGVLFETGVARGGASNHLSWRRSHTELASALVSGVTVPTSIRRGCSPDPNSGFNEELLFITEGGGFSDESDDRRILAFALPEGGATSKLESEPVAAAEARASSSLWGFGRTRRRWRR